MQYLWILWGGGYTFMRAEITMSLTKRAGRVRRRLLSTMTRRGTAGLERTSSAG